MKHKVGFCYEIFKNQAFWSHNGEISYGPCSFYDGFIDQGVPPDQSWFGGEHRKVISIVERNDPVPGCHRCYAEEAAGRISRRQSSKRNYEEFLNSASLDQSVKGPEGIDYSVGNLCNLKCVICGPNNSSSWIPDYQKIWPDRDVSKYLFKKNQQIEISDGEFLGNVKSVHFHGGGEPLMSDAHVNFLQAIEQVKGLSDVRVFYNTNGTQTVSDHVLDLWQRCRLVEIYFSIDDIGPRFEYQRTGARWTHVTNNIEWFKTNMPHNHMFNINCVWGYLNLYYLDQLVEWHRSTLPSNRYGDPCNLIFQKCIGPFGIEHLGSRAMSVLSSRFQLDDNLRLLLIGIPVMEKPHDRFWHAIESINRVRGNSFRELCPEWSELL